MKNTDFTEKPWVNSVLTKRKQFMFRMRQLSSNSYSSLVCDRVYRHLIHTQVLSVIESTFNGKDPLPL
jgi:hypothetical protein